MKAKALVDDYFPSKPHVHVYSEGAAVWDVALNQIAIDENNNKYYII